MATPSSTRSSEMSAANPWSERRESIDRFADGPVVGDAKFRGGEIVEDGRAKDGGPSLVGRCAAKRSRPITTASSASICNGPLSSDGSSTSAPSPGMDIERP